MVNKQLMIAGIGIDMIEVERVAQKIEKNSGFLELVFSAAEISYCERKTNKFEHYAARFAAKEAFLKAIGTGWTGDVNFNEIEILNNEPGKPVLTLSAEAAARLPLTITNIHVSMSHLKTIASAVVVLEADLKNE